MRGFGCNGSMAEEEAGGVGAVAAAELDCCTVFSSEVSSSFRPAKDTGNSRLAVVDDEREGLGSGGEKEGEDELELGLSLGAEKVSGNGGRAVRSAAGESPWGEYCRILTAKDFPSIVASQGSPISSSSSTASSSPSLGGGGGGVGRAAVGVAGTKRAAADSVAPEVGSRAPSQVVGWPPIRAYRMNNLMNQSRDNSEENNINKNNGGSVHHDKATGHSSSILRNTTKENVARKEHEKKGSLGGVLRL